MDADPRDTAFLIQQLAERGVRHLRAAAVPAQRDPLDTRALISALAQHPEPRLREALIPLFLRHPADAPLVPGLTAALDPPARLTLQHMYTAAVYLQRLWREALSLYLGGFPLLPNYFGQTEFGLPDANEYFGEAGLRALARHFEAVTGYEWLSAYQSIVNLMLEQLSLESFDVQPVG
ncbi:MAG: hypothetical protein HYR71_10210 [Chloroflexi bacterium]|nr:hypothetical protein [Chloroflexota bacterium]